MKKLNIIEASALINTEFEVIYPNGNKRKKNVYCNLSGSLKEISGGELYTYTDIINAKFIPIPIPKPVSFMEAVESGKKVKVDYSDIDTDDNHAFSCEDYRYLASLIFDIVNKNGSKAFKEIILNGKWYIED